MIGNENQIHNRCREEKSFGCECICVCASTNLITNKKAIKARAFFRAKERESEKTAIYRTNKKCTSTICIDSNLKCIAGHGHGGALWTKLNIPLNSIQYRRAFCVCATYVQPALEIRAQFNNHVRCSAHFFIASIFVGYLWPRLSLLLALFWCGHWNWLAECISRGRYLCSERETVCVCMSAHEVNKYLCVCSR